MSARKIAATLASTGQPATFVHAAEASHGDLGMVQNGDVVLAISWSGETAELAAIVTYAKRFAIPLIAITANGDSALGREADVCLAPAERPGGLPERPRADHLDDDAARARRRAGDRAARRPRASPRATSASSIPAASSAPSSPMCATSCTTASASRASRRRADGRRDRRNDAPRASAASACSTSGERLVGIITDGDLRRHLKSDCSSTRRSKR